MTNVNVQMDIATMALKGKRYNEAESVYMQIATQNNSPEAWIGMGLCKLYQLADGRTMDEVLFCIDKAKQILPDKKNEIENQLIISCQVILNAYLNIFEDSLAKQKELRKKAQTGAILAGISVVAGMNSKSTFGTIASLAGTGAGVGVAVDAINKMNTVQEIQRFILDKCDHINNALNLYIDKSNPTYLEYNNYVNNFIKTVNEAIKLDNISQKWYMNKVTLICATLLFWPVGVYGWYMRYRSKQN
jgi:hypothetical protein